MGNLPEMVIGLFTLHRGLSTIVKASLSGSLLGNLLLNLGLALLAGGVRFKTLRFNVHLVGIHSKLLLLATTGLIVPALFHYTARTEQKISVGIAAILFLAYLGSLAFTLITHRQLFAEDAKEEAEGGCDPARSMGRAIAVLSAAALALAATSEALTGALEPTSKALGLGEVFTGIFLLAPVGNRAELINAVQFARRGRMNLTIAVTYGGATQIALLVAPFLIFAASS
jgi:Ca2+:H+ antiporter